MLNEIVKDIHKAKVNCGVLDIHGWKLGLEILEGNYKEGHIPQHEEITKVKSVPQSRDKEDDIVGNIGLFFVFKYLFLRVDSKVDIIFQPIGYLIYALLLYSTYGL